MIAQSNSLPRCNNKPWEVSVILTANSKDVRISVKRTELLTGCN